MARPTLDRCPKYKLLIRQLGLPRPYVRGLLEVLWDTAHECGNPVLGSPESVEAAAEWPGEPGTLFAALRDGRWIDERQDGAWEIHDYWDHAPDYVRARYRMERWRKKRKAELDHFIQHAEQADSPPLRNGDATVTERYGSPAPAPINTPPTPQGVNRRGTKRRDKDQEPDPPGFTEFWSAYPKKVAKGAARKAWSKLRPSHDLLTEMLAAITAQKESEQWTKEGGRFVPNPATWLNGSQWEDELPHPGAASRSAGPAAETEEQLAERVRREREQFRQQMGIAEGGGK